jgi:hypothetical protein
MRRSIKRKYENIMMEGIEDRQIVKCLMELIEQNCKGFAEEYTSESLDRLTDSDDVVHNADDEDNSGHSAEPNLECPAVSESEYEVLPEKRTKVFMS